LIHRATAMLRPAAVEVNRAPELAAVGVPDTLFAVFRALLPAALVALCVCASAVGFGSEAPSVQQRRPDAAERPNVLLVTLDTTRADHLGVYGYARDTSPHLDRLATESVVYTRAIATSSWTLPSHASLFTGKLPTGHGARFDSEGSLVLGKSVRGPMDLTEFRAFPISEQEVTLAERLRQGGYATGGVVGGPWLKRVFGLARGFEFYADDGIDTLAGARGDRVTDAALRFLEDVGDRPFFLFVNYYDPHGPYAAPLRHRLAIDWRLLFSGDAPPPELVSLAYDAEIHFADAELGRLLGRLRALGLYDDTLVVVTADHGELLGEHGRFHHGYFLTEPELHVPLIVKHPRGERAGEREIARVSIAGVFALILERLSLEVPAQAEPPPERAVGHPVVAETYPYRILAPDGQWRALYQGSLKYLWNSLGRHELFDLESDPGEERNLVERYPEMARRFEADLDAILARVPPPPRETDLESTVDAETREALRNLGYLP
jgi:arylsulfatase A-like enzyme